MLSRRQILQRLIVAMNSIITATLAVPVIGYVFTPLLRKAGVAEWISLGLLSDFGGPEPKRVEFRYTSQVGYVAQEVQLMPGQFFLVFDATLDVRAGGAGVGEFCLGPPTFADTECDHEVVRDWRDHNHRLVEP